MFPDIAPFFTDSVLRAPTIASMLMCLTSALMGVVVFLRKQSLVGESLSHASYPGVILGLMAAAALNPEGAESWELSILILCGAFSTALLGLWTIHWMQHSLKVSTDASLCFVLSSFFGVGLALASRLQFTHTAFYKQVSVYLFGQAATMTDIHIVIYAALALFCMGFISLFFKEIQVMTLDRMYAMSLGIPVKKIEAATFVLVVLAVVIGIRSVGVVLMSGMLIAPAATARQFTPRLSRVFILAAVFGLLSGFLGNYFSFMFGDILKKNAPHLRLALPTGPMIITVATIFCFFSLCFAPERGWLVRLWRMFSFRYHCISENLLKILWRKGAHHPMTWKEIRDAEDISPLLTYAACAQLLRQGWIGKNEKGYHLTTDGTHRAARIVRLHRLWEVYLANYLGVGVERVHRSAEEMEHIITAPLEEELTKLLNDPTQDPHHQPIPKMQETLSNRNM